MEALYLHIEALPKQKYDSLKTEKSHCYLPHLLWLPIGKRVYPTILELSQIVFMHKGHITLQILKDFTIQRKVTKYLLTTVVFGTVVGGFGIVSVLGTKKCSSLSSVCFA